MNHLIIIGHPDKNSFCYNGIFQTIKQEMSKNNQVFKIIDLYSDDFTRPREKLIDNYKKLITWSDSIYIISPVWWFRLTPRMEVFFDEEYKKILSAEQNRQLDQYSSIYYKKTELNTKIYDN